MDSKGSATMSQRPHEYGDSSMDLAALAEIVEKFAGKKIVLFGDFVADEFQYGEISRVSREAPVLILRHRGTTGVPGGGANAANNLAALGAKVFPVTVVGEDAAAKGPEGYCLERCIETGGLVHGQALGTPARAWLPGGGSESGEPH